MKNKFLFLISLFLITIIFSGCNSNKSDCNDEKILLEGKLEIIQDKYSINVITTSNETYWMYGGVNNFQENLNKNVKIEASISYFDRNNTECSICIRKCEDKACQCPSRDLLYDVKIIEILE